jgi:hypothetical membrane protein
MFTTGRIVFTLFFVLAFAGILIWGYRKDLKGIGVHYKKNYKVLIALLIFIGLLYLIVKIRKFL